MQQTKATTTNKKKTFILAVIGAVLVIAGLVLFRDSSTAQLTVNSTGERAQVFINQSRQERLSATGSDQYQIPNSPTDVLVNTPESYPWRTTVEPSADDSTRIAPFLVPQESQQLQQVPEDVRERMKELAENPPTTAESEPGNKKLFVDHQNRLTLEWTAASSSMPEYIRCQENGCGAIVFDNADHPITQVSFYPGRSDVGIFATTRGVYAIEIDPTGETQNFQPIASNLTNPHFLLSGRVILIRSDESVTATQL